MQAASERAPLRESVRVRMREKRRRVLECGLRIAAELVHPRAEEECKCECLGMTERPRMLQCRSGLFERLPRLTQRPQRPRAKSA